MRLHSLIVVAAGLMGAADPPKVDAFKSEAGRLQGGWVIVSIEVDGQQLPEEELRGGELTVLADHMTFTRNGSTRQLAVTFKIDSNKKPKTMDWDLGPPTGETAKGIYALEADTLKMCMGAKRPTEFKTKPKSNQKLIVAKRNGN